MAKTAITREETTTVEIPRFNNDSNMEWLTEALMNDLKEAIEIASKTDDAEENRYHNDWIVAVFQSP